MALLTSGCVRCRNPKGGVESLRAIPWIFAWTQTRLNLPAWLGVGEAMASHDQQELQAMYRDWPWFRTTVSLVEMILAKSDAKIAGGMLQQYKSAAGMTYTHR